MAKNTQMTKWQKLLQFLHPELEVVTEYGPKLLTSLKINPFWSDIFQAYDIVYNRIEVERPADVLIEFLITHLKLVTKYF